MNQKILIAAGLAVLLLGGGGYYVVTRQPVTNTQTTETASSTESEEKSNSILDEVKEETFTGSLKAAVELGVPMKCTYKVGDVEYEGHIKGEQYKGRVEMPDGKTGNVIMKENCMYTWADDQTEGMKLCFTDEEKSMWEQTDETGNIPGDYVCRPAVITDDEFDLPEDVNFMDLESMMDAAGVEIPEIPEQ